MPKAEQAHRILPVQEHLLLQRRQGHAAALPVIADSRPDAARQLRLSEMANSSSRAARLSAQAGTMQSAVKLPLQRMLSGKSQPPVQLATNIAYGGLTDFSYKPSNDDDAVTGRVATAMKAELDPTDPKTGTDTAGSNAFDELFASLQKNTATSWVRGHLLNHDLGGIAFYNNLYPITTNANGEHYHEVEKLVKHWIGRKNYVTYQVKAEKDGDDETPDGKFICHATITGGPDKPKSGAGPTISKTIESKANKANSTRRYSGKNVAVKGKFAKVAHHGDNNVFRDSYKSLRKDAQWDHDTGSSKVNNRYSDEQVSYSQTTSGKSSGLITDWEAFGSDHDLESFMESVDDMK